MWRSLQSIQNYGTVRLGRGGDQPFSGVYTSQPEELMRQCVSSQQASCSFRPKYFCIVMVDVWPRGVGARSRGYCRLESDREGVEVACHSPEWGRGRSAKRDGDGCLVGFRAAAVDLSGQSYQLLHGAV